MISLVATLILVWCAVIVTFAPLLRWRITPRQLQRNQRRSFVALLLLTCGVVAVNTWGGMSEIAILLVGAMLALLATSGYVAFLRKPSERDVVVNYAMDRGHCGQCGYDLTGNVSGACPECGWQIPRSELKWERQWELVWFRPWRISYLHNWRTSLLCCALGTLYFAALVPTAWFGMRDWWDALMFSIVVGMAAAYFMIHAVRIIDYARRQRDAERQEGT